MNKRMESWDAGDFGRHFRGRSESSTDEGFKEKFGNLASALEPMGREFCRETASCGRDLASVMEDLQRIAGKEGYCERPRGFERDCESLYRDVDGAISRVESLRDGCFL